MGNAYLEVLRQMLARAKLRFCWLESGRETGIDRLDWLCRLLADGVQDHPDCGGRKKTVAVRAYLHNVKATQLEDSLHPWEAISPEALSLIQHQPQLWSVKKAGRHQWDTTKKARQRQVRRCEPRRTGTETLLSPFTRKQVAMRQCCGIAFEDPVNKCFWVDLVLIAEWSSHKNNFPEPNGAGSLLCRKTSGCERYT